MACNPAPSAAVPCCIPHATSPSESLPPSASRRSRRSRTHPIFFHHILAVSTITDSIATPCKNHSQIVEAKRVPASRGGQTLPDSPFKICAGKKRSLTFSIPEQGLTNRPGRNGVKSHRKQVKNQQVLTAAVFPCKSFRMRQVGTIVANHLILNDFNGAKKKGGGWGVLPGKDRGISGVHRARENLFSSELYSHSIVPGGFEVMS